MSTLEHHQQSLQKLDTDRQQKLARLTQIKERIISEMQQYLLAHFDRLWKAVPDSYSSSLAGLSEDRLSAFKNALKQIREDFDKDREALASEIPWYHDANVAAQSISNSQTTKGVADKCANLLGQFGTVLIGHKLMNIVESKDFTWKNGYCQFKPGIEYGSAFGQAIREYDVVADECVSICARMQGHNSEIEKINAKLRWEES